LYGATFVGASSELMKKDALPNDEQRRALGELLHHGFNFLRHASEAEANALAYALHNIPVEMYGWGTWDVKQTRGALLKFQTENYARPNQGPDFVAMFDAIFPRK
jgi:hypothetical protein